MKLKVLITQYGWQSIPRAGKKILRYLGVNLESFYLLEYKIDRLEVEAKMKKYDYSDVQEFFYIDIRIQICSTRIKNNFLNNDLSLKIIHVLVLNLKMKFVTSLGSLGSL